MLGSDGKPDAVMATAWILPEVSDLG